MATLFHNPFCPFSRKIRLILGEKKFSVNLVEEQPWKKRLDFLMINPSGELPVLEQDNTIIAGHYALSEWLEENGGYLNLLPNSILERAEIRRLTDWFDNKFYKEVGEIIIYEKITRRFMGKPEERGTPNMDNIRIGLHNLKMHMDYIHYLLNQRDWLGGNHLSLADITAAAHLSCLDYTGEIAWKNWADAKAWYARIKSRPSFRPILKDRIQGLRISAHYTNLDF